MTDYDALFDRVRPAESVFAEKAALDPLAPPEELVARKAEQEKLARVLTGFDDGYLPGTVSVHGPPGTGKTTLVREACTAFAAREPDLAIEYVNLKECRTLFAAANEILFELTGEKLGSHVGLDGVFEAIWDALEAYPEWMILILDEVDQLRTLTGDSSEFFYRLLRGEGRLKRGLNLSVWLISNELVEVDLRVDSRVRSALSGVELSFTHYDYAELKAVCAPRVERAFREGAVSEPVFHYAVRQAADRWGDARRALTLFRQAGELANDTGSKEVTADCVSACLADVEHIRVRERLVGLPATHRAVLVAIAFLQDTGTETVTTSEVAERLVAAGTTVTTRRVRDVVDELADGGLVETWIDNRGRGGRVKQLRCGVEAKLVLEAVGAEVD